MPRAEPSSATGRSASTSTPRRSSCSTRRPCRRPPISTVSGWSWPSPRAAPRCPWARASGRRSNGGGRCPTWKASTNASGGSCRSCCGRASRSAPDPSRRSWTLLRSIRRQTNSRRLPATGRRRRPPKPPWSPSAPPVPATRWRFPAILTGSLVVAGITVIVLLFLPSIREDLRQREGPRSTPAAMSRRSPTSPAGTRARGG